MSIRELVFGDSTQETRLEVAELADLLRSERRQYVLDVLDEESPTRIGAITDTLAIREYGADYSSTERKRIYVGLYQSHLDTLADAGIIEWDHPRVARGPEFDGARTALDELREVTGHD